MLIIPNEIMFEEVERQIASGNRVHIRLQGDSMLPMMRGGRDVVELGPVREDDIAPGAVVLCRCGGRHILHRIVGIEHGRLTLLGDGNLTPEYLPASDVVAVLRAIHRPSGRVVTTDSRWWRFRSRAWMALRPVRRILMAVYRRLN